MNSVVVSGKSVSADVLGAEMHQRCTAFVTGREGLHGEQLRTILLCHVNSLAASCLDSMGGDLTLDLLHSKAA